jgi:exodeoxyribonuclease VII small subunit
MPKAISSTNSTHSTKRPDPTPAAPLQDLPASYEAALAELERLVAHLESGQMPLDQVLSGYQRGAGLLAFCRDRLQLVEQQIEVLDAGTLKPWKPE